MTGKKDFTQTAFAVFQQAVGEAPKPKLTARQEAGRKGGLKGGKTRMATMSDEEKAKLSALGVAARKAPASSGAGVVSKVRKTGR